MIVPVKVRAAVVGVVVPVQPGEGAAPAAAVTRVLRGTRLALVDIIGRCNIISRTTLGEDNSHHYGQYCKLLHASNQVHLATIRTGLLFSSISQPRMHQF